MKVKLSKKILANTVSLKEAFADIHPEYDDVVANEIRYYKLLMMIKEYRKKSGLTQAEVAKRAHLPRTTVTKVESGMYNPTINTLMSIAAALNKQLVISFK